MASALGTTNERVSDERLAEMVEAGLAHYSEGGCLGLAAHERREVVADILTAALSVSHETGDGETGACPAPDADSETYYSKGKDGPWFEALSDKEFAWEITKAHQDLNDSGLGDDLDRWMPFQVMIADAAERITRLLATPAPTDETQGVKREQFSREWSAKRIAAEGDLEVGVGFTVNPTPADAEELDRLAYDALPDWVRARIETAEASLAAMMEARKRAEDEFGLIIMRLNDKQPERAKRAAMCGEKDARTTLAGENGR